jgi:hypothetical protein
MPPLMLRFPPIPEEIDERRMPVAAGGDERPVPRHGTVVDDRPTLKGVIAPPLHQKISGCKVPVVAVAAGDGRKPTSVSSDRSTSAPTATATTR